MTDHVFGRSTLPWLPYSSTIVDATLADALAQIKSWDTKVGFAVPTPSQLVVNAYAQFAGVNPNNIGYSDQHDVSIGGARRLEAECVGALSEIVRAPKDCVGWLTSGGTEGIITGVWLGRDQLRRAGHERIAVLSSRLCHGAVNKAAHLLGLGMSEVNVEPASGAVRASSVSTSAASLVKQGADAIVLVLTLGNAETGACDDVRAVIASLPDSIIERIYIHVDASLGGLTLPFTDPSRELGFTFPQVGSMNVEPHKMALVPLGSGAFLCRRGAEEVIQFPNARSHNSPTLLGSRPGAAAAATWAALFSAGRSGLRTQAIHSVRLKMEFLQSLRARHVPIQAVHDRDMSVVAVRFLALAPGVLPADVSTRFGLYPVQLPELSPTPADCTFYRFKFLPHHCREIVDDLVDSLTQVHA